MAAIGDALADTELTIDELTEAIVDRTGPWAGERTMEAFQDRWPRWRQLTSTAAHRRASTRSCRMRADSTVMKSGPAK